MDKLQPIEAKLAELFKSLPDLSPTARKTLAGILEWVALIFGVLQLLFVFTFWGYGHRVNEAIDYVNSLSNTYGSPNVVDSLGIMYYIALLLALVSAILLLIAYPGLRARKKIGWDWIFLGALLNIVFGVVALFVDSSAGGGLRNLFSSLIGSTIGFYLLFQVRDQFTGKVTPKADSPKK